MVNYIYFNFVGRKSENAKIILETASYLFWTKGYEAVGVNDICKEAGINKGTLYHFYKNKKELVLAVIQRKGELTLGFFNSIKSKTPADRVSAYFEMMINAQSKECKNSGKFAGCPFGNLSVEMSGKDDEIRDAINQWFAQIIDFISVAISEQRGIKKGSKALAAELFTYLQGAQLMSKTANSMTHLEGVRDYTINYFESIVEAAYQ